MDPKPIEEKTPVEEETVPDVLDEIKKIKEEYEALLQAERDERKREQAEAAQKFRALLVEGKGDQGTSPDAIAARVADRLKKKYSRI